MWAEATINNSMLCAGIVIKYAPAIVECFEVVGRPLVVVFV